MKKTIVVNLFGPPGAGKSVGAAYIYSKLKMMGVNCELVTEYAKDKTWEANMEALSNQAYVFGHQYYRMSRCANKVDVIITDSPLPLNIIYNKDKNLTQSFDNIVIDVYNTYDNINFMIRRVKPYNTAGRNETEKESDDIAIKIEELLDKHSIFFECQNGNEDGYNNIIKSVINKLENRKDD